VPSAFSVSTARQAVGDRRERLALGRVADDHARAAVLDEIGQLIDRVGGVERQEDHPA
jgi:uncharacterized protein YlxP (DUF503 family)